MGRTPLWMLFFVVGFLSMAPPASADTATDIYRDYVSDGRIDGAYSDGALAAVADDASLFQYGDPSVTLGLRRAARQALEGGRDTGSAGSPPARPAAEAPSGEAVEAPARPGDAEDRSATGSSAPGSPGDGGSAAAEPPRDPPGGAGLQAGDPGPLIGIRAGILFAVALVAVTVGLGLAIRRLRR